MITVELFNALAGALTEQANNQKLYEAEGVKISRGLVKGRDGDSVHYMVYQKADESGEAAVTIIHSAGMPNIAFEAPIADLKGDEVTVRDAYGDDSDWTQEASEAEFERLCEVVGVRPMVGV